VSHELVVIPLQSYFYESHPSVTLAWCFVDTSSETRFNATLLKMFQPGSQALVDNSKIQKAQKNESFDPRHA